MQHPGTHSFLTTPSATNKYYHRLIKEFEMDARADGMPAPMLAERKRDLVNQINGFIEQKKAHGEAQVIDVEG